MTGRLLSSAAPVSDLVVETIADERFLSTGDLARRWGRSVRTLEGWRHRKQGPPFIRINRLILYRLSDVLAFEASWRIDSGAADSGGAGDGVR